jgi:hypothetical protein
MFGTRMLEVSSGEHHHDQCNGSSDSPEMGALSSRHLSPLPSLPQSLHAASQYTDNLSVSNTSDSSSMRSAEHIHRIVNLQYEISLVRQTAGRSLETQQTTNHTSQNRVDASTLLV